MLLELRVQNLLLIEDARVELTAGLNVLTGETGAGKTVLAHALDLLLGGRARSGIVRPGASEAYVEGIFELDRPLAAVLAERLPDDAEELILARRVGADGRTRAYLNGRSIPVAELRELAGGVLSFYGQHEHRRLMLAAAQLEILDGFCGPDQVRRRAECAEAWSRLREARAEHERLRELAGARERELDLLEFELAEIEGLELRVDERDELSAERERLRHLEALRSTALEACGALADEGGTGAGLAGAAAGLETLAGVDAALDPLTDRVVALSLEAQDLVSELRSYAEGLETDGDPGRLEAVEERLAGIARLERKHGGTVSLVLEHAERCSARRDELLGAEVAIVAAEQLMAGLGSAHAQACSELRGARAAAAPALSAAVCERLAGLAMADASFAILLGEAEPGPGGADAVVFEIAPNPGVPAAPLRESASGGELSRVMLALLGAATDGSRATLVFDEVDAGIGGQTARAVGEQLRTLAAGRQIVCITHLPQVASFAARHFTIVKDTTREPARTTVTRLDGAEVVSELVRMLGADDGDAAARRHAKELLRAA
ncbi:MAG: repair protein RecN [Solirubrobacteraceae bacterium]|jgi:DNA repair protein RecN (Recombination protein N)|nr:repair protein RecN [Solirubrobacteraceae bacterium]